MDLSIIVPVYNERATIMQVLERLDRSGCRDCQWIVVDDGSTDGTSELLKQHVPTTQVCIAKSINQGKSAAVRAGLALAASRWVIIQDADLEYDPADIVRLYERAEEAGVVPVAIYGQRPACWNRPSR